MTAVDVAPAIALVEQDVRALLARLALPLDDALLLHALVADVVAD